jgi:TonB family protein
MYASPRTTLVIPALAVAIMLCAAAASAADTPRPESQQEYWAQFDRRDWTAATAAAEKLVAAARKRPDQPLELADTLSLLGNAQLGRTDFVAAEAAFTEALQILEPRIGAASTRLLDPLRGLGYTLAASGRHGEAIAPLDRALLIARRGHGLFDASQQGVLRQLALSLTKTGRSAEAERHIIYLMQIAERAYGRKDPRQVPVLCFGGDWYADTGNFITAREIYRRAIEIVEGKLGPNDPAAVEPLRAIARSYTQELYYSTLGIKTQSRERSLTEADGTSNESKQINPRYLSSDGEKALARALKILEAPAAAGHEALVPTLLQFGDWYQVKHLPDRAMRYYRRAAALSAAATPEPSEAAVIASTAAAGGAEKSASSAAKEPPPLSFPVRVYYPMPPQATRHTTLPREQVDETFVEVQFTVTNEGDVANAKVTEQNGTARQASEALQAIRAARYRPKFVNGEPVETAGMTNREIFRTRKADGEDNQSD